MRPLAAQLRYTLRKLALAPGFTIISIMTLALGIGANSAIFSVVNGVLLKPLPFDDPDDLVGVWHTAPGLGFDQVNQSPAMYFTYRDENRVFEDIGLWDNTQVSITGIQEPEQVAGMYVTDGVFPLLRLRPLIGRAFSAEDDLPGNNETVILSHGYWQRNFGGDVTAIGQALRVNGRPREIIGIMPPGVRFLQSDPEVYLPFQFDRAEVTVGNFSYQGVARLAPEATLEQANQDIARMIPMAVEQFPGGLSLGMLEEAQFGPLVHPLKNDVVGDVGSVLWVLLGTVGLILVIACANVTNLFLVRAEARQREIAIRSAMGASRTRIAKEFLFESTALGVMGGITGLAIAYGGLRLLLRLASDNLPRANEITIDPTVLGFTVMISLVTGLLFGIFPILQYGRPNMSATLKEGGRGNSDGKERHRLRNSLAVAQIALASILLIGSGLMVRTFQALRTVNPGFQRPQEVMTFRVSLPRAEIGENAQAVSTYEQIYQNLQRIPGVSSVGMSFSVTMDGWDSNDAVYVEDFPTVGEGLPPIRRFKWIAGDYFEAMENPLVAGRSLTWSDTHQRANAVVVTENFAREYWDEPSAAVGKRIRQQPDAPWRDIVGVVGDVRDDGIVEEATPVVYWPLAVRDFWGDSVTVQRSMAYVLRSAGPNPNSFLPLIRDAVWSVNRNLPIANARTLDEILQNSMARTAFTLVMLTIAAAVAVALGAVGIYGVVAYTVSQRTREIGVRMALGAKRGDVSVLVLRQGAVMAVIGIAVGALGAVAATRLMSALLFGVNALDPLTFGTAALGVAGMALLASYIPARRAAGIDPTEALRWE